MPEEKEIVDAILAASSISDVLRRLDLAIGGANFKKVHAVISKYNLDTDHLKRKSKYRDLVKTCPVCSVVFTTTNNPRDEKVTCSCTCSNRYFRTKHLLTSFNPATQIYNSNYRTLCLNYYGHKCAFCDWKLCVDVHHIDRDRTNNHISNLVPLCPNHHALTKLKEHRDKIDLEIEKFKIDNP